MKQAIQIFRTHKKSIENYLYDNINNNHIDHFSDKTLEKFFHLFKSLEALFVVDMNHSQITPRYTKNSKDAMHLGEDRSVLFDKVTYNSNGYYISSPYICAHTGHSTITVVKKIHNHLMVMDFNLMRLLSELDYMGKNIFFDKITKYIYGAIGYGLALFALVLVGYSVFSFGSFILFGESKLLETIFKSIIALTLGLAIFDLAKNLLEHEVIYKNNSSAEHDDNKILTKFLISIIIALSIEALMVVFKIALQDYTQMHNAVYLIAGVSLMIISLGLFYKYSKK
ncbi:MAG: hypothetical protein HOF69_03855 [Campylobacteraceae bacterium]|jgi:hypothetical protein|nr:hypothetical protein [Campylobacteraceae bacterium]MBT3882379.1 hypothetical protein [Campylobacteraceae bacterium]MBT4031263.1 hypothetical protein [Campylobacteraceae bacterium]MBT4178914.1 hypothetical protein [Campylobacteraceae bacterium]MBT4573176.1 hypothetical protein [Campylobacteraceae bacterium]